ncbi:MAG TPA: hypothetical protein DIT13_18905 [Verrucomicrobiales bacterium]|nr:hypothetical protein [Verrucomicrobiales bacterium]HRJ10440.1 hypothetical protein [Prosthecobacter sp.]HRK14041.1 hypothetical protein [Prosthecobacter sp.]
MPASSFPPNHPRIRVVGAFDELVTARFESGVNALCWPRVLEGDFEEVVMKLKAGPGITHLTEDMLRALPLSAAGRLAAAAMLDDYQRLADHGLQPALDCVNGYEHAEETGPVRTDVCSWHADSATAEVDTWLCTYHGASTEGLINEEAIRRVDVPETRAELLKLYGGADDGDFREWLNERFYDLHYAPLPHARPYAFGAGNLWRIATLHDSCAVPPCVHRAPGFVPGQKRLLLIS